MKISAVLISALTSLAFALGANAATSPVGSTPGSFAVSPSGAATYTIPIQVPPGVNGMQPDIALVYNSQAGNGIAGVGWDIGGLSEITRCGATIDRDGFKGGVNLDWNDKYCLDGQRLIAINGTYGGNGTEYRTEIESFSKITSHGTTGNGPTYFVVKTKSGQTMEYGNTVDSRGYATVNGAAAAYGSVVEWSVNKIQDALGHYVQLLYNTDSATTGEHRIDRIEYTMVSGVPIGSSKRVVQFNYSPRGDVILSYVGGGAIIANKALESIKTYLGYSLVRSFNMGYEFSTSTNRSRLKSVQECGADAVCLQYQTEVSSNDTGDLLTAQLWKKTGINYNGNEVSLVTTVSAELNGDGLSDQVHVRTDGGGYLIFIPHLSTSSGAIETQSIYRTGDHYNGNDSSFFSVIPSDVNGDGRTDLIHVRTGSENGIAKELVFRVHLSNGRGGFSAPNGWVRTQMSYNGGENTLVAMIPADLNGDGLSDLVHVRTNGGSLAFIPYIASPNGAFQAGTWYPTSDHYNGDGSSFYSVNASDVNGDGRTDLVHVRTDSGNGIANELIFKAHISNGQGGFNVPFGWVRSGISYNGGEDTLLSNLSVDVNGDGLADQVHIRTDGGVVKFFPFLSKGDGSYIKMPARTGEYYRGPDDGYWAVHPADMNGDGRTDLVHVRTDSTTVSSNELIYKIYLSDGVGGFSEPAPWVKTGWTFREGDDILFAVLTDDVNGDGKSDFVHVRTFSGEYSIRYRISDGIFPDLIKKIRNGFGSEVQIFSRPLTSSSVYLSDFFDSDISNDAGYPKKDVQTPTYVVERMTSSNGLGGAFETSYFYFGAKEHLLGRGNLGFRQMTVTGPDGSKSTTTFAQQWPFIGMPVESKTEVYDPTYARWVTVSSSQNYLASAEWTSTIWNNTAGVPTYVASPTAIPASASLTPPVTPPVAGYFSSSACSLTDATRTCLPFVDWSYSLTKDFNSNTAIMSALSDTGNPDRYGNMPTSTAKTYDGYVSTTTNTLFNDATNWRLGLLVKSVVSNTVPAAFSGTGAVQTLSRKSVFVYELGSGTGNYRLKSEVVEPATDTASTTSYAPTYTLGALTAVTSFEYDATYGFRNKVTASGNGITARSTSTAYVNSTNPGSLYPEIRVTNALGHTETTKYDARFGVPLTLTGPNNLTTTWEYDGFGRKTKELRADGTATTIALNDCGTPGCYLSSDLGYARYSSTTRALNTSGTDMAPAVTVYYDILGRELRTESLGFNGGTIYKDTVYDSLGRVKKSSRPYFNTQTAYWTTPTYDALGRAYQVTTPDGAITTTTFNGLSTTVQAPSSSDGKLRKRTETKNSQGQLVTMTDALNSVITYKYDAFGNLTKVINPVPAGITATSNTITTTYDIRGRKTAMTDPDMGTWTYTYNVLGEMLTQKDAKNQTATMTYDLLGRMTQRVEAEGTSTWTYDTAANGKGKLASVTGPTNSYSRSYVYDSKGRVSIVGTSINGTLYNMSSSYDPYTGRVTNVQFPATVAGATTFAFYNNYNARGYLEKVTSGANGAGTVYWQVNGGAALGGMDAEGNLTGALYGNGVSTTWGYDPIRGLLTDIDTTGPKGVVQANDYAYFTGVPNLQSRGSNVAGYSYSESFTYDELNRLTSSTIGTTTKSITYDSLGNIRSKTGVGTYTYGGTRPHAVTGVTGTFNGVTNPTYTYDANGNQLTGAGRTLTYTSFNLPKTVATSSITQSYAYDAEHGRIVMTQGTATTVYINPRWDAGVTFEKETNTSGVTEYKHYIYAGSKPVAMHIVSSATPSTPKTRYLHTDHLGSVEAITSEDGTVLERFSYDPWGKRRNANGTDATTTPTSTITKHGYTGHEMVDAFGLVNMNGRWYDPSLARVMQADPLIQAPAFLDSYNRYTYVWNNPLSNTDPSGFETWMSKRKWKRATRRIMRNLANTEIRIDQSFGIDGVYEHRWNKTYRVGGLLVVGATATPIGTAYAWSNNDWETVNKGHATIAVMVAAFFLMPAAPAHPGFWAYAAYIGQSMAVSYGSSYATARIWGASASQAHQAGIASARTAALFASMRLGYEYMKTQTNYSSALSGNTLRDPKDGDLFTYGGRPTVNVDGSPGVDQTWFPGANMTQEVDGQQNGFWDIDWMRQFFNRVSKVHDYGNSWAYDMMGNWISRGPFLDTLFQAYSGSTMVPAAAYMVAANYGGFTDMAGGVNQNVRTNW